MGDPREVHGRSKGSMGGLREVNASWEVHGRSMGDPRDVHGGPQRSMRGPREVHGRFMGAPRGPWEVHGRSTGGPRDGVRLLGHYRPFSVMRASMKK